MQVDFTSSGLLYEFYTPMLATSVKPLYATAAGGTLITISGCEPHLSRTFVTCAVQPPASPTTPLGGLRGVRSGCFLGCYVTKCAPHKALKLIMRGKSTFDERLVLHRVAQVASRTSGKGALLSPSVEGGVTRL